jgi:hypothetical protein
MIIFTTEIKKKDLSHDTWDLIRNSIIVQNATTSTEKFKIYRRKSYLTIPYLQSIQICHKIYSNSSKNHKISIKNQIPTSRLHWFSLFVRRRWMKTRLIVFWNTFTNFLLDRQLYAVGYLRLGRIRLEFFYRKLKKFMSFLEFLNFWKYF